jgi:hypothetical protein
MSIATTSDRIQVVVDPTSDGTPHAADSAHPHHAGEPGESGAGVGGAAPTRSTFTITDAATACSVSRKTITRKLPELAAHGAAKDDDGVWRIPVEALLAVGLHPGRALPGLTAGPARPAAPTPAPTRPAEQETITIPRDRWDDVRIRLARAEAEASERGLALADARLALRALTAGPVTAARTWEVAATSDHGAARVPDGEPATASPMAVGSTPADPAPRSSSASTTSSEPSVLSGAARATEATAPVVATQGPPEASGQADPMPVDPVSADAVPADIVAARNLAARTGGYVPAGATRAKKRHWWKSR